MITGKLLSTEALKYCDNTAFLSADVIVKNSKMSQELLRSWLKDKQRTLNPQEAPRQNTIAWQVENLREACSREAWAPAGLCYLPSKGLCWWKWAPGLHQARLQTKGFGQKEVAQIHSGLVSTSPVVQVTQCCKPGQDDKGVGITGRTQFSWQETYCSLEYARRLQVG